MRTSDKTALRQQFWDLLEKKSLAAFPRPVYNRIPNFVGSGDAARKVMEIEEWSKAVVVKVNPDSPQREIRRLALLQEKTLIMPSPRLKAGFLVISTVKGLESKASTIRGALQLGHHAKLSELPSPDILIAGSVAVSMDGHRLGKGGGYFDLEYGILRELKRIDSDTPVITTVLEEQVVSTIPREDHDALVDYIVTPKRILRTSLTEPKPDGVRRNLVSPEMLNAIPLLSELEELLRRQCRQTTH